MTKQVTIRQRFYGKGYMDALAKKYDIPMGRIIKATKILELEKIIRMIKEMRISQLRLDPKRNRDTIMRNRGYNKALSDLLSSLTTKEE